MYRGALGGPLAAAAVAGGNIALGAVAKPNVQVAIDTAVLAVLVLLLDHLRERERRDRAEKLRWWHRRRPM